MLRRGEVLNRLPRRWLWTLWLLVTVVPAQAHLLNMTRVSLQLDPVAAGTFELTVDLGQSLLAPADYLALAHADEAERSARLEPIVAAISSGLLLTVDGVPISRRFLDAEFVAESIEAIANPLTPQMATLRFELPPASGDLLEVRLAPDFELPWPWLVRVDSVNRDLPASRLLTPDRRGSGPVPISADADSGFSSSQGFFNVSGVYAGLGILHIVPDGLDHVLFILGLFLVGGTFRELLILVSCFTIAHTVTLGAAVLGFVSPPAAVVEPLIAASIVYVGLEALFGFSKAAVRYAVVFAFGLLHGLGFASVLQAIGLPDGQYVLALLSFNVGVELGQLLVLGAAFLLLGAFRSRQWYVNCIVHPGAMLVAGTGAYWLIERI